LFRYEGKKNSRLPKEQAEHLRMKKKHKREFKATSRAIRLDNEFIAREELQQQMAKFERKEFWRYIFRLFLPLEMRNENEKSKNFKQNYRCKKENFENYKNSNRNKFLFLLFFSCFKKNKRVIHCFVGIF